MRHGKNDELVNAIRMSRSREPRHGGSPVVANGGRFIQAHSALSRSSFTIAFLSSLSLKAKKDARWPFHRTPFQTPCSPRYMILNMAIEPWCQCSNLAQDSTNILGYGELAKVGIGDRNRGRRNRVGEFGFGCDL